MSTRPSSTAPSCGAGEAHSAAPEAQATLDSAATSPATSPAAGDVAVQEEENRRRRPTLGDVAQLAGVDLSTASRLLRDKGEKYRPETRQRVLEAAAQLGYRANIRGRALRLGRSETIAVLVPDIDNFGFTQVLRGIQQVCDERGYTLLIAEVSADVAHGQDVPHQDGAGPVETAGPAAQGEAVATAVPSGAGAQRWQVHRLEGRVDGVLVASATAEDTHIGQALTALDLPAVFVQRGSPHGEASVVFDEESNAAAMVDHLAHLGHQRIGHVSGAPGTDTALRRQRGFEAAMARHGLPVDPRWRGQGDWSIEGGRSATMTIMTGPPPHPTALAVDSLVEAIGALSALRDLGVGVPRQVSVLAIDEHLVAAHTSPPLTTVRLDQRELGRRAASMLLERIEGKAGAQVTLPSPTDLVVRASTAAPPP